jgi:YbbR domain-containing protein
MIRLLRNFFLKNWTLKLISLLLAFFLWLLLIPEEKTSSEKTLTIPLETYNIPAEMELVQKPAQTIDVTVRAPNRLINQISAANVYAVLNLERASVFQEEYPLNSEMISVPPGAKIVRISPNKVNLKLERTSELLMDVIPNLIGKLQEGYRLEKIDVSPAQVQVKGPESKVRTKEKVRTSPIDISGLTQSIEIEADLILPRPELRLSSLPTRAKISLIIQKATPPPTNAKVQKKSAAESP